MISRAGCDCKRVLPITSMPPDPNLVVCSTQQLSTWRSTRTARTNKTVSASGAPRDKIRRSLGGTDAVDTWCATKKAGLLSAKTLRNDYLAMVSTSLYLAKFPCMRPAYVHCEAPQKNGGRSRRPVSSVAFTRSALSTQDRFLQPVGLRPLLAPVVHSRGIREDQ